MTAQLAPPASRTTENAETERWIYGRLSGSAAVAAAVADRIFSYVAPPLTAYPLVTFAWQGDRDVKALEGTTIWVEAVYTVKCIAENDSEQALAAALSAVHSTLHGASGLSPSGDGLIISCLRDSGLAMGEVSGGRQYRTAGALYRIRTQLVGT